MKDDKDYNNNNNNDITTSETDTGNQNYKNNLSLHFDPENNPLDKAVFEGISGVSNTYFEAAHKAVFEIIRGHRTSFKLLTNRNLM